MSRSRFTVCVLVLLTLLSVVPPANAGNFSPETRHGIAEILGRLWQTIARLVPLPTSTTAAASSRFADCQRGFAPASLFSETKIG
jgi:hypothetical protein